MNPSEQDSLNIISNDKYNATCIHCASTQDIQLWPHRNGHGDMIGFVFGCAACFDVVKGITLEIHGIRAHDTTPSLSCSVNGRHECGGGKDSTEMIDMEEGDK